MTDTLTSFVTWLPDTHFHANNPHHTACGHLLQATSDGDTVYCPQCKIIDEQAHHAFQIGMDWIRAHCADTLSALSFTEFGQAQALGTAPPAAPHLRLWEMSVTLGDDPAEAVIILILLLADGSYAVDTTTYLSCHEVSDIIGCYCYVKANSDGTYLCPEHGQVERETDDPDDVVEEEDR